MAPLSNPLFLQIKSMQYKARLSKILLEEYDYVGRLSDERKLVIKGGQYGFVDSDGYLAIPCQYDFAMSFIDNKAFVESNGVCFYINKFNQKVKVSKASKTRINICPLCPLWPVC